jgi:hypothetical protein
MVAYDKRYTHSAEPKASGLSLQNFSPNFSIILSTFCPSPGSLNPDSNFFKDSTNGYPTKS